MVKTKVLVIEDEVGIRRFLRAGFSDDTYDMMEAATGKEGIAMAASFSPDVILLDMGLPDTDGVAITTAIRSWSLVPIIVVSARERDEDKIQVLDAGADDYITKPFSISELLARVRVAMRHSQAVGPGTSHIFEAKHIRVDLAARRVWRDGKLVSLTPNEYKLLGYLIRHAGKVVTHRQLLSEVWGQSYVDEVQYLRVYVGQLRQKLEMESAKPQIITTEPGVGYRLLTN